ncbi:MAG: EVE domain-containing protein [Rubinisphaera brasiliensis]|uniref:Uncharacterized protein family UPF0310 n=1 Tax=Rubinisphaera brasiliensis (strain ATCC 49424 / DSM 5305 / JCM 21570 / IAM 15109 / NBRC 103401 / IFAM 1448) TaxID=756272 RepID=F0SQG2_RUBBR|nr:EVE domain-containing protein [Rubinisphaera brasiliensis]ADY57937.1 Uncharacterized protein family UPF0310 [Rubinisphaera brasiliensis DSM 5305]MBB03168.1 EVE domain-containing protein [Planctomyces sp.]
MPKKKTESTERRYWLFKSEADCFSIDDLKAAPKKTTFWDGVRNYQVRNMLRDEVKKGDLVLYYHSNSKPLGVVGTAEVVKEGYPDHTAYDPKEDHYDPKSDPEDPRWFMVDVKFRSKYDEAVTRDMLKDHPVTSGMMVMQKGSRLSITPVTAEEFAAVEELAGQ